MKKAAEKALTKAKADANKALSRSKDAPKEVKDAESAEVAAEVLVAVSKARKDLDERRKAATKPAREEQDEINGAFNEIINALKGPEKALQKELDDWEEKQERVAEEERKKAEEEAIRKQVEEDEEAHEEGREADEVEPEEVEAPTGALRVGGGTVGGVKTWTAEVEDLAEIPYDFLIDLIRDNPSIQESLEVALRAYAKKHKDKAKVAGVRFFQKRHRSIR